MSLATLNLYEHEHPSSTEWGSWDHTKLYSGSRLSDEWAESLHDRALGSAHSLCPGSTGGGMEVQSTTPAVSAAAPAPPAAPAPAEPPNLPNPPGTPGPQFTPLPLSAAARGFAARWREGGGAIATSRRV